MDHLQSNDRTLDAYDKSVEQYIECTAQVHKRERTPLQQWLDASLDLIPQGGSVFEIGSATPRDANYMRRQGYAVQCSDGSRGFVKYLRQAGEPALHFNILKDHVENTFDMIFANAVVPHFTQEELYFILKKINRALQAGQVFAFSTKYGQGCGWVTEKFEPARFITYWQPHELIPLIEANGFDIVYQDIAKGDFSEHIWIMLAIRKRG